MFKREVKVMSSLTSDRIIRFFGYCEDDGAGGGDETFYAIAMERAERGALSQVLLDDAIDLPWGTRLALAVDICDGVAYLHGCNVCLPLCAFRELGWVTCGIACLCEC